MGPSRSIQLKLELSQVPKWWGILEGNFVFRHTGEHISEVTSSAGNTNAHSLGSSYQNQPLGSEDDEVREKTDLGQYSMKIRS